MERIKEDYFNKVYSEYSKLLFGIIYSYTKSRVDSEDILQEVFISFLEKNPSFKNDNELKYYLIRISINKTINFLKKKSREFVSDEITLDIEENDNSNLDKKEIVLKLVYSLDKKYRDVIVLYYFSNMKIDEISKALRISLSAVKMRLKRAKEILELKFKENALC